VVVVFASSAGGGWTKSGRLRSTPLMTVFDHPKPFIVGDEVKLGQRERTRGETKILDVRVSARLDINDSAIERTRYRIFSKTTHSSKRIFQACL
jgi:hypothetical protein